MLYYSMPALAAGFILDLMIGDPRWLYHPVCLIGNLIAFLEKILRKIFPKTDKGELAAGTVEVILVCLLRWNPISDPAHSLRDFSMGGIRTGDLLVLSASGNEVSENREHESL
jgi:cobalamin biosynthesis protein CobD/CbiB